MDKNKRDMSKKIAKCNTCKHYGGQGTCGTVTETKGDNKTCMAAVFGDFDNEDFSPMPAWVVTYGNSGNSKGNLRVHKDYGCINHNKEFDKE